MWTIVGSFYRRMLGIFWPYLLAIGVGVVVFCNLYTWGFLQGKGAYFSSGDAAQHVSGWRLYADDAWRFPLLKTTRLMYPAGESIAFTDSIPLMALPFKVIAPLLPGDFHYFGYWHLLVYLLQAFSAALLARMMGAPRWSLPFAAYFAVTFPALTWRLGHSSLMMHALILFALAVYFGVRRGVFSGRAAHGMLLGCQLAAFFVHPYLFAMVFAIGVVTLLANRERFGYMRGVLITLSLQFAIVVVVVVVFGYLHEGTTASGFGIYSMNLWSPWVGGRFTPAFIDATTGQSEGFNYLGLGALLLIVFTFAISGKSIFEACLRHWILIALFGCFLVYAASSHVYAGRLLIYEWPDFLNQSKVTGTFRASGRFFWPVGYMILFGSIVFCIRAASRWVLIPLSLCAVIQWADLADLRASVRARIESPQLKMDPVQLAALRDAHVIACSPAIIGTTHEANEFVLRMQKMAANCHASLVGGYIARRGGDAADFMIKADTVVFSTVLVSAHNADLSPTALELLDSKGGVRCVGDLYILRRDWSDADWSKNVPSAVLYRAYDRFRAVPLGCDLPFNSGAYECSSGWSVLEPTHRWTEGMSARIRFRHDGSGHRDIVINYSTLGAQTIRIFVNDVMVLDKMRDGSRVKELLHNSVMLDGMNEIRFELPDAKMPNSGDKRVLALALHDIRFGAEESDSHRP